MTDEGLRHPAIDGEALKVGPGDGNLTDDVASISIPPYRSSARRATIAIWLLTVSTILAAIGAAADVYGIGLVRDAIGGSLTEREATSFVDVSTALGGAVLLAYIATVIAFLAWLSRAIDNVPGLGAGPPSASPRWAIAWWLIPVANLGMPYEVVRELLGRMKGDDRRRHPPLLLAWWFTFVGGEVLASAAVRMPPATLQQQSASLTVSAIGFALTVVAGLLAILVVRAIEQAAVARADDALSGAPMPPDFSADGWDGPARRTGWRMRPSWVGFVAVTAAFALAVAAPVLATLPSVATTQPSDEIRPHQAPQLEAGLPDEVAGRSLDRWSLRGEDYFLTALGVGVDELAQLEADLALDGLTIEDFEYAIAGRGDLDDPPYFIFAIHIRGIAAEMLPDATTIDHPDAGTFTSDVIAGKLIRRGTAGMLDQTEHLRGVPYLYDKGEVRYIVITDDPDWAGDALAQLP